MKTLRRIRLVEKGFTLVEMMVVCVIIGILAGTSLSLITYMFDANIRSGQIYDQQTSIEESFGYMSSKLATAQKPVGILDTDDTSKVDMRSIAGDQMVFNSGGKCYRVWYAAWAEQIRGKVADTCSAAEIKPVRGPNQPLQNGSGHVAAPSDPDYDAALDTTPGSSPTAPFVLASGIKDERPATADASLFKQHLQLFRYLDTSHNEITNIDENANSNSTTSWYDDNSNRDTVDQVIVSAYVAPIFTSGENSSRVPIRAYRQTMALEQVGGGGGSCTVIAAGMIREHGRIDGESPDIVDFNNIDPSNPVDVDFPGEDPVLVAPGGDQLKTPDITTQDAWLNFRGLLLVSTDAVIKIKLYRNGSPVTTGGDGRYQYDVPSVGGQTSFSGSFKIPTSASDSPSTVYSARVFIEAFDSGLSYQTAKNVMFFDYTVEAY